MKILLVLVGLMCAVVPSWSFLWSKPDPVTYKPEWNQLSVTWLTYSSVPITMEDAKKEGWKLNTTKCQGNQFYGNRFMLKDDPSVMLLFDFNGKIAGMQMGVVKSTVMPKVLPWNSEYNMYIVTVYFTDPKNICSGTRPNSGYMGDKLLLQTGLTPSTVMEVPLLEDDIKKQPIWVPGKCFYSMGKHYWYGISTKMNCDNFFPLFVMYNDYKLNAFGFVLDSNQASSRFEHPGPTASKATFESLTRPLCLDDPKPPRSSMHVFLEKNPLLNWC